MSIIEFFFNAQALGFFFLFTCILFFSRYICEHFFEGDSRVGGLFTYIVAFWGLFNHGVLAATLMAAAVTFVVTSFNMLINYLVAGDEIDYPIFWALGGTIFASFLIFLFDLCVGFFVTYLKFAAFHN
jgi:hypothetical protein